MWIPGGIYRWATQFLPSSHGTSNWREVEPGARCNCGAVLHMTTSETYMLGLRLRCVFEVWNDPETIYYITFLEAEHFMYTYNSYTNLTQAWELIYQRPLKLRKTAVEVTLLWGEELFLGWVIAGCFRPRLHPFAIFYWGWVIGQLIHDINGGFCGQPCLVIGG